jgi:hypothetical protein
MIVGPDGKPLVTPDIVGAPKIEDIKALEPHEAEHIAEPIRQALAAGIPAQSPCNVEFGVVARLVATVLHLQAQVNGEAGEE